MICVTGGAGFIGSALIRYLIQFSDEKVLNIDALTYAGGLESLESIYNNPRHTFIKEDITHEASLVELFERYQPKAIMNLAAESHVDRSINGPEKFIQTNVIGTFSLLQATRKYLENKPDEFRTRFRFLHVSTDEVFGSLGASGYFTEDTPYSPNSPYSASKASSDHLVRAWNHTFGINTLVTNCSNNYGPFQFPEKLIPMTILNALKGSQIPIYGSGKNVRDWLYVDDHVEALYRVLKYGRTGETYNIGGNNELANIDIVTNICGILDDLVGHSPQIPHRNLIGFVKDRPGHDHRYAIDASKIKKELQWNPKESVQTGLKKTVAWYLENRHWWEKIRIAD